MLGRKKPEAVAESAPISDPTTARLIELERAMSAPQTPAATAPEIPMPFTSAGEAVTMKVDEHLGVQVLGGQGSSRTQVLARLARSVVDELPVVVISPNDDELTRSPGILLFADVASSIKAMIAVAQAKTRAIIILDDMASLPGTRDDNGSIIDDAVKSLNEGIRSATYAGARVFSSFDMQSYGSVYGQSGYQVRTLHIGPLSKDQAFRILTGSSRVRNDDGSIHSMYTRTAAVPEGRAIWQGEDVYVGDGLDPLAPAVRPQRTPGPLTFGVKHDGSVAEITASVTIGGWSELSGRLLENLRQSVHEHGGSVADVPSDRAGFLRAMAGLSAEVVRRHDGGTGEIMLVTMADAKTTLEDSLVDALRPAAEREVILADMVNARHQVHALATVGPAVGVYLVKIDTTGDLNFGRDGLLRQDGDLVLVWDL